MVPPMHPTTPVTPERSFTKRFTSVVDESPVALASTPTVVSHTPMSPNTRQRKSRLAAQVSSLVRDWNIAKEDQVDVLSLSLSHLGILERVRFQRKPSNAGRKLTPYSTRLAVWKFWHENSFPSTLTSRPAKLKVDHKRKIQSGLDFVDTVQITTQRKKAFYQSNWYILKDTVKSLYIKFLQAHPEHPILYGTFLSLKAFYVRSATSKDLEMCCCKKHLHARWSIQSLIDLTNKQKIELGPVTDYYSFFTFLTQDCGESETTYIPWDCVSDKKSLCAHVLKRWENLSQRISNESAVYESTTENADNFTTKMQHFVKISTTTKKGKIVEKLKAVSTNANMNFIIEFITALLPKMLHHRNHLKHYHSTVKEFREHFNTISIDIDFSENLSIPVKYEPQSMHWSHEQVTVHSGILKTPTTKSYHPYISNDTKHDHHFVQKCVKKMLSEVKEIPSNSCVLVESDNCKVQYRSACHFNGMQEIADEFDVDVIRAYGIAEHGRGEVDHVGGIAKTLVRKEVAKGEFFENASDIVLFLKEKLESQESPSYIVKEIDQNEVEIDRINARLKVFPTVIGSSSFQVIVFKPKAKYILAAPRICMCDLCRESYGSCNLFTEYYLQVHNLKQNTLRSKVPTEEEDIIISKEYILPGSVCAIAASESSIDTVWFVKVDSEEETSSEEVADDYGNVIIPGQIYFKAKFLEKVSAKKNSQKYKLMKRNTFVYKSCIVYPFVNYSLDGEFYVITDSDLCEVIAYVEKYGIL